MAGIDVEFSLALHDKTGKYFIGRDLIAANADRIVRQLYWRSASPAPPGGLTARVIGRLLAIEVAARVKSRVFARVAPRLRPPRPVLHMDPFMVLLHRLRAGDIVLCHDIGPLTHPDLFAAPVVAAYHKAYAEIAAAAPHMVFVSRASQVAFHARHGDAFSSSRVICPAIRVEVGEGPRTPVTGVGSRYLLTVGSVGARKNQARAIEAFARSGLASEGFEYVLCGGREPGFEAVAQSAQRTPGVRLLDYQDDGRLNWLYDHAAGFVLPSLLEGFGLPVAEAAARGLVPIVSAGGVLEEVAGASALAVDPLDADAIAAAMRQLAVMPPDETGDRRQALARAVARFSSDAFARGWREAIDEALASG